MRHLREMTDQELEDWLIKQRNTQYFVKDALAEIDRRQTARMNRRMFYIALARRSWRLRRKSLGAEATGGLLSHLHNPLQKGDLWSGLASFRCLEQREEHLAQLVHRPASEESSETGDC